MPTLVVRERVEHIHARVEDNHVNETAVNYLAVEVTEHSDLVREATSALASHYERYMARGGDAPRPSGLCIGHRMLAFIVVHFEANMVLATKQLWTPELV